MNLKLKEGKSIAKHLNDFKGMIAHLSVTSLSLDDETRACLLLGSLPDSWNNLVSGKFIPKRRSHVGYGKK